MNAASTGVNERQAIKSGILYNYVYITPQDKVNIIPECKHYTFQIAL